MNSLTKLITECIGTITSVAIVIYKKIISQVNKIKII